MGTEGREDGALRAGLDGAVPPGLGVGKNGEGRDEELGEGEVERTSPDYRSQPAPPGCGGRAAAGALARGPSGTGELLVGIHYTPGIRGAAQPGEGKGARARSGGR